MYKGYRPGRGYENDAEIVDWAKEANVWATFYMLINDDNERHMDQSFESNGGFDMTAEQLHHRNLSWARTTLDVLDEKKARELLKDEPEMLSYLDEVQAEKVHVVRGLPKVSELSEDEFVEALGMEFE